MIKRCYQPSHESFIHYGAKGIQVADRWRKFENFLSDMGLRPEGCTLGRHGDSGNYQPGNVSWQTLKEQGRKGERHHQARLNSEQVLVMRSLYEKGTPSNSENMARDLGMDPSTIYNAIAGKSWKHI